MTQFGQVTPDLTDLQESVSLRHDLEELVTSRAWRVMDEQLFNHQQSLVAQMVAAPTTSLDATLAQEYYKGQIAAITVLRDLPNRFIDYCQSMVELNPKEDEDG